MVKNRNNYIDLWGTKLPNPVIHGSFLLLLEHWGVNPDPCVLYASALQWTKSHSFCFGSSNFQVLKLCKLNSSKRLKCFFPCKKSQAYTQWLLKVCCQLKIFFSLMKSNNIFLLSYFEFWLIFPSWYMFSFTYKQELYRLNHSAAPGLLL